MFFTKVELHNFGIYKGTHEMHLCDKIGEKNITLVCGLNGRGKTTFHDAILLALYGKACLKYIQETAKSFDKLLLDHISKDATDGTTYVAVTLVLDDETKVRVMRTWRKRGEKAALETIVEKNGIRDKVLSESWSYYIEEILPFGIARFFFFNNEKITQLADDSSFEQIKNSIKSAIGVTTIEKAIDHLDEVIRRKNTALEAFEKSEENIAFHDVEKQLSEITKRIEIAIHRSNELELECQKFAVLAEAKEREFWSSGGELSRNRDIIKSEMRRIASEMESVQTEIIQLASTPFAPLYMCKSLVKQAYDKESELQQGNAQKYSEQQMILAFRRIRDRLVEAEIEQSVLSQIFEIMQQELGSHVSAGNESQHRAISSSSMLLFEKLLSEVFLEFPQKTDFLTSHVDSQESELMSLDSHLGSEDEKTLAMRLYEALKAVEKKKNLADDAFQKQKDLVESMKKQREGLMSKRIHLIKLITEKENRNENNTRILKYAAMSIEALNAFKIRLQEEKVSQLSSTISKCFGQLVEKESLVREIRIDPRTLDITIIGFDGKELLKSQLSAGEQQMFAVSVVWALALTSGYKAPVIIDTPMARLDSENRTNFVSNYLPAASNQVVVLTTDEEIYGQYLDMIKDRIVDYYTLQYHEEGQYTSIVRGFFEVK